MKKVVSVLLIVLLMFSLSAEVFAATTTSPKAIVIIPGMLGSELETTTGLKVWVTTDNFSMMQLNENGTSAFSIRSKDNLYGAFSYYQTLYTSLNAAFGNSFDIIFFDYDFRLNNSAAATKLASELSGYNEVVLVAHSMGGLVAARFLANSSTNRAKTSALISLGAPFLGSAKTIKAMETGEMIGSNGVYLYMLTLKALGRNSYAAYQLLPTNKYYSKLGIYPISVNGINYTSCYNQLINTDWGTMSNGSTKPQFNGATTFHSSLLSGSTHVINYNDVNAYTISGNGIDTISKVKFDQYYNITGYDYSNVGDGTVMKNSAGYGNPTFSYSNVNHMGLISNTTVINKIKTIITSSTGISPSNMNGLSQNDDLDVALENEDLIVINDKGWMIGPDNRRINIIAAADAVIQENNRPVSIEGDEVYDLDGIQMGHVWNMGNTGKVFYALKDGRYSISTQDSFIIEYMDDGYYYRVCELTPIQSIDKLDVPSFDSFNKPFDDIKIICRDLSEDELIDY